MNPREVLLGLGVSLQIGIVRWKLRQTDLTSVLNWTTRGAPGAYFLQRLAAPMPPAQVAQLVNDCASTSFVRGNCLARSLVLLRILAQRNPKPLLRVGVRRSASASIEAHAWVEIGSIPINDVADVAQQYAPFSGDLGAY
ncbi:MAG: lasso peptide biosynthesis B2 protein, partial [Casimicrobium sp.]